MKRDVQIKISIPADDEERLKAAAKELNISLSSLAYILLWQASYAFSDFGKIGPQHQDKVRNYTRKSEA